MIVQSSHWILQLRQMKRLDENKKAFASWLHAAGQECVLRILTDFLYGQCNAFLSCWL